MTGNVYINVRVFGVSERNTNDIVFFAAFRIIPKKSLNVYSDNIILMRIRFHVM